MEERTASQASMCKNIKEIREQIGIKQKDLAKLAGITNIYLSEIEKGRKVFTMEAARKIADALNELHIRGFNVSALEPINLRAEHIASFYGKDIQERIKTLLVEIEEKQAELYSLLEQYAPYPTESINFEDDNWLPLPARKRLPKRKGG